jgi:1-acyl-sn-glycerol-3-phosphate acyltransferase
MRGLALILMRIFFRSAEVDDGHRLPKGGPVLVVANHTNGLVDGLLLMAELRRYPRFLGKSTLWKILPLRPFLRLAGVVPIHRPKDGETVGNEDAFRTCRALLAAGGVVAVFPEGISHDEASLQPLRTGAARIALGAAFEDGARALTVVPVGLAYENKARFRSRALVTVGEPIAVAALASAYRADGREAARRLTDQIDAALRAVGPDFASAAQAGQLGEIADIAALPAGRELPERAELGDRETVARGLARLEASGARAAALAELRDAHAEYRRDLALIGMDDAHLAAPVPGARLRATIAWSLVKVVVWAPFAAAGLVIHLVLYEIVKRLARLPKNEGVKSTVKVLGCFLLFLVEYVVLAVLAWAHWGLLAGIGVFVACPLLGYATVRYAERLYRIGGLLKAFRILRSRGPIVASVHAHRERVRELAAALISGA